MLRQRLALIGLLLKLSATALAGDTLAILFTGDVLLDRGVRPFVERNGPERLFAGVDKAFRAVDAVVINLECPLTDIKAPIGKRFVFRGERAWAKGLQQAGITHAALANNHTNDQGRKGLEETYTSLRQAGIVPLGYGRTAAEQLTPTLLTKNRIKVALFNAVMFPLENWQHIESKPGICQPAVSTLAKAISTYKTKHPDEHIVTIVHWGMEFQSVPHLTQRQTAKILIEAGCDAIVGHHPHVVQHADTVAGQPVLYSLGNFVFDQTHPDTRKALMVTLRFTEKKLVETIQTPVQIKQCRPCITAP